MTDESIRQHIRQQHAFGGTPFEGSGPYPCDSPHFSNPVSSLLPNFLLLPQVQAAGLSKQFTGGKSVQSTASIKSV